MLNDQVLNKVDEIIDCIKNSDDYKHYLLLKDKLRDDKEINLLFEEIKRLQKYLVNHSEEKSKIEPILEEKNTKLRDNPIYRDYLNTIAEINNTFNIIENELNKYFFDKLN